MPKSPKYEIANRLTRGRLRRIVEKARREERSFDWIARTLHADHGIVVTGRTVSNWVREWDEALSEDAA